MIYLVNETMLNSAGYKILHGDDLRRVAGDPLLTSMRKHFYKLLGKPERPSQPALLGGGQQQQKV
jgi:hypothetical protein